MVTLLSILDVIVLLLLIVHLIRRVREKGPGFGSLLLTIFVALAVIVFAVVSLGAYLGLAAESSTFTQAIFLLILLAMSALVGFSWSS
jgi:hypothetical protein